MKRGLHSKLVLIMLLMIASLMTVVCAFLIRGVLLFYQRQFYEQMRSVFANPEFVADLRSAAAEPDGARQMEKILAAYKGQMGIDSGTRSYFVLDGTTGAVLAGDSESGPLEITPNIITALTGREGNRSSWNASYMDVALPISGGEEDYIVYIADNKNTVRALNKELFVIIINALAVGFAISVLLSFILAKTMVIPIQSLTRAAERVASGDFSEKIEARVDDEIGVLTRTFDNMAGRLHNTLEDIENERNKLSAVFLHMTDGIVAFSKDGSLIHFNPAAERLLGISFEPDPPGYDEIFGDIISFDLALGLKGSDVLETERQTETSYLEIFLVPYEGEGRQGGGVLAVIHDITEQRRSDEQRREFVANVSHELRTPITSIRSYAETIEQSLEDMPKETVLSFLGVIINETDRIGMIVKDLLQLSQFDSGRSDMRFEPFNLTDSLRRIHQALILEAAKHKMEMTLDTSEDLPMIEGDKSRIEQVILNIVSNAVRYTPEGGRIVISAKKAEDKVDIKVEDNGIGVPEEDLPHIFERFYRVDKARSRSMGGTGLGLAISREIVVRHGGTITIQSQLGRGTAVTVTLPVRQGGGEAA